MKSLVIFDLDGTLIKGQTQRLFLKIIKEKRWISCIDYIFLTLWFIGYKLGFLRNTEKMGEWACKKFKDVKATRIDAVIEEYFMWFSKRIFQEAYALIEKHRRQGDELLVISSSIEPIVKSLCGHFGIGNYLCTKLEARGGIYTGKIMGKGIYENQKIAGLQQYVRDNNLRDVRTVCYADHILDLPLLLEVDEPICVNPDSKLRAIARSKDWRVMDFRQ